MTWQLDGDDGRAAGRAVDAESAVDRLHPLQQPREPAARGEVSIASPSSVTVISSLPPWSLTLIVAWPAPLCLATLASNSAAQM